MPVAEVKSLLEAVRSQAVLTLRVADALVDRRATGVATWHRKQVTQAVSEGLPWDSTKTEIYHEVYGLEKYSVAPKQDFKGGYQRGGRGSDRRGGFGNRSRGFNNARGRGRGHTSNGFKRPRSEGICDYYNTKKETNLCPHFYIVFFYVCDGKVFFEMVDFMQL